eukprot:scaffold825_cov249-Pinguiococcus_pyrenoidosus.AAC.12
MLCRKRQNPMRRGVSRNDSNAWQHCRLVFNRKDARSLNFQQERIHGSRNVNLKGRLDTESIRVDKLEMHHIPWRRRYRSHIPCDATENEVDGIHGTFDDLVMRHLWVGEAQGRLVLQGDAELKTLDGVHENLSLLRAEGEKDADVHPWLRVSIGYVENFQTRRVLHWQHRVDHDRRCVWDGLDSNEEAPPSCLVPNSRNQQLDSLQIGQTADARDGRLSSCVVDGPHAEEIWTRQVVYSGQRFMGATESHLCAKCGLVHVNHLEQRRSRGAVSDLKGAVTGDQREQYDIVGGRSSLAHPEGVKLHSPFFRNVNQRIGHRNVDDRIRELLFDLDGRRCTLRHGPTGAAVAKVVDRRIQSVNWNG